VRPDQLLVRDEVRQRRRRHLGAEHDDVADAAERRRELLERRELIRIDEDHAVVGVPDDVREILEREPDVQRVEHAPGARHGEVALEVPVVVPRERRDPLPAIHAERVERVHELLRARRELRVGVAVEAAVVLADDLDLAEVGRGVLEQEPRVELGRHHRGPRER
jgi:hypothetical protein